MEGDDANAHPEEGAKLGNLQLLVQPRTQEDAVERNQRAIYPEANGAGTLHQRSEVLHGPQQSAEGQNGGHNAHHVVPADAHVGVANARHRSVAGALQRHPRTHLQARRHAFKIQGVHQVEQVHTQVLHVAVQHEVCEETPELALLHARRVEGEETIQPQERSEHLKKVPQEAKPHEDGEGTVTVTHLPERVWPVHEGPQQGKHPEHGTLTSVHAQGVTLSHRRTGPAFLAVFGPHHPFGVAGGLALAAPLQRASPHLCGAVGGVPRLRDARGGALALAGPAFGAITRHQRLLAPLEVGVPRRWAHAGLRRADAHLCCAHGRVALANLEVHRHGVAEERCAAVHAAVHGHISGPGEEAAIADLAKAFAEVALLAAKPSILLVHGQKCPGAASIVTIACYRVFYVQLLGIACVQFSLSSLGAARKIDQDGHNPCAASREQKAAAGAVAPRASGGCLRHPGVSQGFYIQPPHPITKNATRA
mmetsp:Transcript_130239/g.309037  ORF Transcript_130239/g.309037 Transcript_130239/m.309037 type:complete len:479 (-) Transcript_130239:7-1443(-)